MPALSQCTPGFLKSLLSANVGIQLVLDRATQLAKKVLHSSCNTGTYGVPDMLTSIPHNLSAHIRQITSAHATATKHPRTTCTIKTTLSYLHIALPESCKHYKGLCMYCSEMDRYRRLVPATPPVWPSVVGYGEQAM